MSQFYLEFGPLLWLITTGLVIIALIWLAWLSFTGREDEAAYGPSADPGEVEHTAGQVSKLLWETMELKASMINSVQAAGLVKYDAYPDVGGEQSFSVAFANPRGDGLVVSSLHGRTNTRVYAKPVRNWGSDHNLSGEEISALDKAREYTLPTESEDLEARKIA